MKNRKELQTLLYILLIIGAILVTGRLEYIAHQEDRESDELCRIEDTEEYINY